jgi:PAS domain S-box-containing protein
LKLTPVIRPYLLAAALIGAAVAVNIALVSVIGPGYGGYAVPFLLAIVGSARLGYGPGLLSCALAFAIGPALYARRMGWDGLEPARVIMGIFISVIVSRMTAIGRDLARKKDDASAAHAALDAVLNAATQTGIVGTDAEGMITLFNTGAESLLGRRAFDIVGKIRLTALLGEDFADLRSGLTTKQYSEGDFLLIRRDGTSLMANVALTAQHGGGYVAIIRDITELRRNQEAMLEAMRAAESAARSRSEFLATVSHEIRTPLNGIIGMTGLLLDSPLAVDQQEFALTIRNSGETLLTIINDILDFSKIEAGKLDLEEMDFDLYGAIEECAEIVSASAHYKGLELILPARRSDAPLLRGDQGRVRQILLNLLSNAIKFTPAGEVVTTVEFEAAAPGRVLARVSVTDTGIGIPLEAQRRLFQAFTQADASTTRRYGGTGLGLAISKRLVELMGGEIGVTSEPGEGATFWFTARFGAAAPAALPEPAMAGKRVLVVDDNATNRRVLELQLERHGCAVRLAASGAEALEALAETAGRTPFDAVLTDQAMPGMDGTTLTKTIRATGPWRGLPILLLGSQVESREAIRQAGVTEVLVKPVRETQLIRALRDAWSGKRTAEVPVLLAEAAAPEGSGRVLVVEDNAVNQRVAALMLRKLGYSPEVVANGAEALTALELGRYQAILMDCQMPEMDGFEATREIRGRRWEAAQTPIIALTANAMRGEREKCLAAGMNDYLAKPLTLEALGEKLREWSVAAG